MRKDEGEKEEVRERFYVDKGLRRVMGFKEK